MVHLKFFFNLAKDYFKYFEAVGWSVNIQIEYESFKMFDIAGVRKNLSLRRQILRSNLYILFQQKLFFNLFKDLSNYFDCLGGESPSEKMLNPMNSSPSQSTKKVYTLSNFEPKNQSIYVFDIYCFSTKSGTYLLNKFGNLRRTVLIGKEFESL